MRRKRVDDGRVRHARVLARADGQRVHPRATADRAGERLSLFRELRVSSRTAEAILSKADCPHVNLRKLFLERRFVFFHCTPMMPAGVAVLLGYGGHYIGSVQVPEGVLEVWEWAFLSNSELNVEKQTPACHSRVVGKNVARARFRVIR